jgi:hypothetical protein
MRHLLVAGAVCTMIAASAIAQTVPPAPSTAPPPAVPSGTSAVVPGENSFTETQVRERLEANGYSGIEALRKGDDGIWRSTATHSGQQFQVMLDYRGNIVRQ